MKPIAQFLPVVFLLASANAAEVGLRIRLGLSDKSPTKWDGTISVAPGKVTQITGWRFGAGDTLQDTKGWTASSRHQPDPRAVQRAKQAGKTPPKGPLVETGVLVALTDVTNESRVEVKTAQGSFGFRLGDVPFGESLAQLSGAVAIDRTATATQLTNGRTDDDFPAMAVCPDGAVALAYISFTPGLDRDKRARALDGEMKDFSELAKPAGGDQLWLRFLTNGRWGEPIAVTPGKGDLFKCGVAVDRDCRAWVFWSENKEGNFDLWARSFKEGKLGEPVRLTTDPGNDLAPVAATDAQGRVWVAWQGARQNVFRILYRRQQGDGWTEESSASSQERNCWDPAIAASAAIEGKTAGRIAIAWDTYEKGDYDVWLREFDVRGKVEPARPVATSLRYEVRPTIAYDKAARLWVAWDESGEKWGKDYGALDKDGIALYQGRWIATRVLGDNGQWNETVGELGEALPGAQPLKATRGARRAKGKRMSSSHLDEGEQEELNRRTFNSFPRLTADRDGRVWLLSRTRQATMRSLLGTIWTESASFYDGNKWAGPVFMPNSENLLDNRPAVVAAPDGGLLLAYSTDHRQQRQARRATRKGAAATDMDNDPFDTDVIIGRLAGLPPPAEAVLKTAGGVPQPKPAAEATKEAGDVKRIRDYRASFAGKDLRILRGEFHRHTEISSDGINDGALQDMWRYGLDAAAMDWIGNGDHDNGNGREYPWWIVQKTTDAYRLPGVFEPMFTYERSVRYPEGHRNVVFAKRGIRTLPRLPKQEEEDKPPAPDTQMLYRYLRFFGGVCAVHTSGTDMGTDWRNNDPKVEPFVEIYQGDRQNYEMPGAPRSNKEGDSIGGWRPKGFVSLALMKGYRLGFQASSDHISTHISYCNVYAEKPSRDAILDGMKARHVYGATDNIIADVRCKAGDKEYFMGDEFATLVAPTLKVKLIGTAPFAKVVIVKDNEYVHTVEPKTAEVEFAWTDVRPTIGKPSYYYVRGEQTDGELVWVSPMWIRCEK